VQGSGSSMPANRSKNDKSERQACDRSDKSERPAPSSDKANNSDT
jgi:hypothetical protein